MKQIINEIMKEYNSNFAEEGGIIYKDNGSNPEKGEVKSFFESSLSKAYFQGKRDATNGKTEHEIICWIAEYAYKKANPEGKFKEPPSIVYEQVEKDYKNFINSLNEE